jgi:hypothetical protein
VNYIFILLDIENSNKVILQDTMVEYNFSEENIEKKIGKRIDEF